MSAATLAAEKHARAWRVLRALYAKRDPRNPAHTAVIRRAERLVHTLSNKSFKADWSAAANGEAGAMRRNEMRAEARLGMA